MDLIARLRPRWRHPDPAVRAEAVRELPADQQERLGSVASGDPDAHVRRIAIKRLREVTLLERIAAGANAPGTPCFPLPRPRGALLQTTASDGASPAGPAGLAPLTPPPG